MLHGAADFGVDSSSRALDVMECCHRGFQFRAASKAAPTTAVVGHPSSAAPVRPGILRNTWKVANEAENGWERGLSGRQAGFHEMGTAAPLEGIKRLQDNSRAHIQ